MFWASGYPRYFGSLLFIIEYVALRSKESFSMAISILEVKSKMYDVVALRFGWRYLYKILNLSTPKLTTGTPYN